jgi:hypothetical protein
MLLYRSQERICRALPKGGGREKLGEMLEENPRVFFGLLMIVDPIGVDYHGILPF